MTEKDKLIEAAAKATEVFSEDELEAYEERLSKKVVVLDYTKHELINGRLRLKVIEELL